jgi:GntP family gluconate:H+ symporter
LHADLGVTLALGIVVAIPTAIICGPLFSLVAARWVPVAAPRQAGGVSLDEEAGPGSTGGGTAARAADRPSRTSLKERERPAEEVRTRSAGVVRPPSFGTTLATILFPVVLMLLKAAADVWWNDTNPTARQIADFIGEPLVALTLAVLLAMVTFGYAVGFNGKTITDKLGAGLAPIAGILLIVGAGGGFKQTLIGAGVGD